MSTSLPVRRESSRAKGALASLCALACLCGTLALKAELVVLGGGDVLKVSAYEVRDDRVLLELASGGRIGLPLSRVERILDDEIIPVTERHRAQSLAPSFDLGFDESHSIPESPYGSLIHDTARRHRLNPDLVAAMVRCESGFDPQAVSPRGARGLLQLMPATAERFGVDPVELGDPARNLEAGARYLRWLADHFDNDLVRVVAAFNSGEGTVERYQGAPPYQETQEYLSRVFSELGLERSEG